MKYFSVLLIAIIVVMTSSCDEDDAFPVNYKINNQSDYSLTFIGYSYTSYDSTNDNDTIEVLSKDTKLFTSDVSPKMQKEAIFDRYLTLIYDSIKIEIEDQVVKTYQHGSPIFNIDNWEFIQNEESFDAYYYLTNDSLDL